MDTPVVALRFRDPGTVDTLGEHLAVLAREGAVWWGWWRKETEPSHEEFLRGLGVPFNVFLVDRSTKRLYLATVLKIQFRGEAEIDRARIPAYYREGPDDIAAWFLLSSQIAPVAYSEAIDSHFAAAGNATLLNLGSAPSRTVGSLGRRSVSARSAILHLSDLHFGKDYAFLSPNSAPSIGETRLTFTGSLVQDLRRIGMEKSIGVILITGDFTTAGDWSDATRGKLLRELHGLLDQLEVPREHLIALPGNHDVVRYPDDAAAADPNALAVEMQRTYKHESDFRMFMDELTGRDWQDPLNYLSRFAFAEVDLDLIALNSCAIAATNWTEYGYVGAAGKDILRKLAKDSCVRPTYRILSLHHHLLPVNYVDVLNSKGVSLTLDAVELLDAACEAAVQIAIHGHQHLARIACYRRLPRSGENVSKQITVVSGGSAGVSEKRRGSERNTYSVFELGHKGIRLRVRELRSDGRAAGWLFDDSLEIGPIVPEEGAAA